MLLIPFIPRNISNWSEFFKTYGQYVISYYIVARTIYRPFKFDKTLIDKSLSCFQIILTAVVILQFILVVILKQYSFYNLWGKFQLYYELKIVESNLRMKAFYLEPSYLGFVAINLFWCRQHLIKRKLTNSNMLMSLMIIILSKSAFAFISLFILTLYEIYFEKNSETFKKYKVLFYITIPAVLLLFSSQLFSLFRLNELSFEQENATSGYMRLVFPIVVITKILITDKHFLGLSFGQLDLYLQQFSIGGYHENSISNSFFAIIAYWGIAAIIVYLFCTYYFLKSEDKLIKSFIILVFLNLNNSGAFVTTQYVFITFLLPLLVLKINIGKKSCVKQNEYLDNNSHME